MYHNDYVKKTFEVNVQYLLIFQPWACSCTQLLIFNPLQSPYVHETIYVLRMTNVIYVLVWANPVDQIKNILSLLNNIGVITPTSTPFPNYVLTGMLKEASTNDKSPVLP